MEQSQRQHKIGGLIQKELAIILQQTLQKSGFIGIVVSVTKVRVTVDLSIARIYISIFPKKNKKDILSEINQSTDTLRYKLSTVVRQQLRKIPQLVFYEDDSLDYIESIENSLKKGENPIENRSLLSKRKPL